MRKAVFIFVSLLFTGGLLLYTAQANLDLLTHLEALWIKLAAD